MKKTKLKVILVGCGKMGRNHLRVLLEDRRFQVMAVVDPGLSQEDPALAGTLLLSSLDEVSRLDWDCAVVTTPTVTHMAVAKKLIPIGRPILMEKPLASTRSDCLDLIALGRKHKTILAVGHLERFNPAIRKLHEVIRSGGLGDPIHFTFTRVGGYPESVAPGNNVLLDLAVHDLDILRVLVGPMKVRAALCHSSWRTGVLDTAEILTSNDQGVSASLHVNWITPTKIRTLRVTGTRGVCFVDYILQTCVLMGGSLIQQSPDERFNFETLMENYKTSDRIEFGVKREEPLKVQLDQFYKLITEGQSQICQVEEAAAAVELAEEAIQKGLESVQKVI